MTGLRMSSAIVVVSDDLADEYAYSSLMCAAFLNKKLSAFKVEVTELLHIPVSQGSTRIRELRSSVDNLFVVGNYAFGDVSEKKIMELRQEFIWHKVPEECAHGPVDEPLFDNIHFLFGPRSLVIHKFSQIIDKLNLFVPSKEFTLSWNEFILKQSQLIRISKEHPRITIVLSNPGDQNEKTVSLVGVDQTQVSGFYDAIKVIPMEIQDTGCRIVQSSEVIDFYGLMGTEFGGFLGRKNYSLPVTGAKACGIYGKDTGSHCGDGEDLHMLAKESLDLIYNTMETYGVESVSLSFNGGKDSTIALHLTLAARLRYSREHGVKQLPRLKAMYSLERCPFVELLDFVSFCELAFDIDVIRMIGSQKSCLSTFLSANPDIKVIVMGNRKTDPHCEHLMPIQKTDEGWPSVIRVHPLLNWDYYTAWNFIFFFNLPYCSLYDYGYTSLGGMDNTYPNPNLENNNLPCGYSHASALIHQAYERSGRKPDGRGARSCTLVLF